MKKLILFLLAGAIAASAQYSTVPPSSYSALNLVIDSKPAVRTGVGAPTGLSCTAGKDFYVNVAGDFYVCPTTNTWVLKGDLGGCTASAGVMTCPGGFNGGTSLLFGGACVAASSIATPATGSVNYFCDSGNSNHLTGKLSTGSLVDLQAGGGGSNDLSTAAVTLPKSVSKPVTAIGDSLTRGYGWGATKPSTAYPAVLHSKTGANVINLSIGGYDSGQILSWMSGLNADQMSGLWIIWAGRNDVNGVALNGQTTVANVAAIVSLINGAGGDYIVMSVINSCAAQEYTGGSGVTNYNAILATNASLSTAHGVRYLDIRGVLVAQDGGGHDCPGSSLTSSGVHLNDTGYALVATSAASKMATRWGSFTGAAQFANVNPSIIAAGTNSITLTTNPTIDALDGKMYCFAAANANSGATTINLNGLVSASGTVTKIAGAALLAGDITTGVSPCVIYNAISTHFELLNPQTVASGGGTATVTGSTGALFSIGYPATVMMNGTAGSRAVKAFLVTTQAPIAMHGLTFDVTTAAVTTCNGGAGPCAQVLAIYTVNSSNANPPVGVTLECGTVAASYGGAGALDTSTTGIKKLPFGSGSAYAGGVCTLPAGSHTLVMSDEGGTVVTAASYNAQPLYTAPMSLSAVNWGYVAGAGTGTGTSSYAIPAISGLTFSADTFSANLPSIWWY